MKNRGNKTNVIVLGVIAGVALTIAILAIVKYIILNPI